MSLLDFQNFARDPNIVPFVRDFRHDLLASNIELEGASLYIICKHKVPKGQLLVVKALVPYAMERTAPGTNQENAAFIDPQLANGQFIFEPKINGSAPFIASVDFNAMSTASAADDSRRVRRNGFTHISLKPRDEAMQQEYNPLFSFLVPGDSVLTVTFSILPLNPNTPIPSPYTIGVNAMRRVDYAGIIIAGVEIPEQLYRQLEAEAKKVK